MSVSNPPESAYFDNDGDDGSSGGEGSAFLSHIPAILWQRRWLIIIPLVLALIAAIAAIVLLPSIYRSSALLLVQSPQLPGEYTGGDNTEAVERRIARIRDQITSRPDLITLIEKHSLYKSELARKPLSEVVDAMRNDIVLEPSASDAQSTRPDQRTIAFRLSYDYSEGTAAQAVTQELMERILELDANNNANRATNTVQFLTDQAKGLENQIAAVQGQISAVTTRNGSVLGNAGIAMMGGGGGGSYDFQIAQLQRDTSSLLQQKETLRSADTRNPNVAAAEAQLAAARAVYSENHPDVVIAKQRLAQAKELAKAQTAALPVETIDQQIAFNNAQISSLRAAKAREQSQVSSAMQAQSRAPAVQHQIGDLQQQLTGLNEQYKTVSDRLMAARAGVRADGQQMSERLLVVDPPVIPDQPVKPNRWLLAGIGAAAGLGAGLLLALGVEMVLRPVRDPASLASIIGEQPLGIVPVIKAKARGRTQNGNGTQKRNFWRRRTSAAEQEAQE